MADADLEPGSGRTGGSDAAPVCDLILHGLLLTESDADLGGSKTQGPYPNRLASQRDWPVNRSPVHPGGEQGGSLLPQYAPGVRGGVTGTRIKKELRPGAEGS